MLRASEAGPITSRLGGGFPRRSRSTTPSRWRRPAEFATPILGRVVSRHGRDRRGVRRPAPARRRGGVLGPPGPLRRAAGRHAGPARLRRSNQGVPLDRPGARATPLATTLDRGLQTRAESLLALQAAGTATALVAIRPSDGAILPAASVPGATGSTSRPRAVRARLDVQGGLGADAAARGAHPAEPVELPATVSVDGNRSRTRRLPGRCRSARPRCARGHELVQHRVRGLDRELGRGDLAEAAEAIGARVDQGPLPGVLRQVPPPRSETEAAADLIGQGTALGLADDDGDRGRLGAGRADRACPTCSTIPAEASPQSPLTGAEGRALQG